MAVGSLLIVGTGIKLVGHVTLETRAFIEGAEKLFYLVNEPATAVWIEELNETAESLSHYYAENKLRLQTYQEITNRLLEAVRQGQQVCAVFYGHPGVFVTPVHEAIRQARHEGFTARMLPGISAADCLYADLGIDPAHCGCQSYEATEFLLRKRQIDPTSHLILWQIGVVGELYQRQKRDVSPGLQAITAVLLRDYPAAHPIIVYEAAQYPVCNPSIEQIPLEQLPNARVTAISTLYVPPTAVADWDYEMMAQLNITLEELTWKTR
jgi:uncharacterized protein YabN with tetrapyrrole methylase and pyrophosphatase domain